MLSHLHTHAPSNSHMERPRCASHITRWACSRHVSHLYPHLAKLAIDEVQLAFDSPPQDSSVLRCTRTP